MCLYKFGFILFSEDHFFDACGEWRRTAEGDNYSLMISSVICAECTEAFELARRVSTSPNKLRTSE